MGLFGRGKKNEEDIKLLVEDMDNLKGDVNKLIKEQEKLNSNYNSNIKDINEFKNTIESCEQKINELEDKWENIHKSITNDLDTLTEYAHLINDSVKFLDKKQVLFNKRCHLLHPELEEIGKTNKKASKKPSVEDENTDKVHLYRVNAKKNTKPFSELKLTEEGRIKSSNHYLLFDIEQIIDIKNKLQEYYTNNLSIKDIGKLYGINSKNAMYRTVWNIEEGYFDDLIKQFESNKNNYNNLKVKEKVDKNSHLFEINAKRNTIPYNNLRVTEKGIIQSHGKDLPYTMNDIILLKNNLKTYFDKGYNVPKILSLGVYNSIKDLNGLYRLIWNIEEGYFDDLIKEYDNSPHNHVVEEKNHFREVVNSRKKPINMNRIKMDNGGQLFINNRKLKYTIPDILLIKERIVDFKTYPNSKDIYEYLDITIPTGEMLIWRIEEGYFDDLIEEYLSRNHTYENRYGKIYIDNEDTGLKISQGNIIVDCIINDPNKEDVINRLIKSYPQVESKFIRIIGEEYANPNLNKILKQKVKKIEKINNPQKRREHGFYH